MKISRLSVLKQMKSYTKSVKGSVAALFIISALAIPVTLISPKFFQILIDEVMEQRDMSKFTVVVLGLLMVYLLRFLLDGASLFFGNRVLNRFTYNLRKDVLQKYQKAPYSFLEKKEAGDLKMRIIEDVDCLGNFIREQVVDYFFGFFLIIFTLYAALRIDVKMTLYCLLVIPVVFFVNYLIGKGSRKINEKIRSVNQDYYSSTHSTLQIWREIKAQNAEKVFIDRFQNFRLILARLGLKSIRYWGYSEVFNDFKANYLTKVMVYIIGAFFVISGDISVGALIMFSEYFALFFSSLDSINSKRAELKVNTPYYKRIFETLDFPEESSIKSKAASLDRIDINNLCFSYDKDGETLKNVTMSIKKGDYIAIVGKSGCGKTTLVKLLLGLYEVDSGDICWNLQSLRELDKESLYHQIGVVMQDSFLFNMSIRDNLLLSNQSAEETDLITACRCANIYDFIQSLPNGFDTVIGEQGVKLSGGQKQRLAIASALLKQPQLLIFDEAMSALDKQSEDVINNAINKLAKEMTVIVVTHKPATALRAKKVVVMENGKITAEGTHEQLLGKNKYYTKLAEAEHDE